MNRIFTLLSVIVLALVIAGCESMGIAFTCTDWIFSEEGGGTFYEPDGEPIEPESISIMFHITDGNGTTLYSRTLSLSTPDEIIDYFESIEDSIPYDVLPDYNPLTFRMYVLLDSETMLVFEDAGTCSGLPTLGTTTEGDPNIVYPPDNRINWQYGDLEVVVYSHEEGTVVYCYQDGAWLGMLINQAVIDNAPTGQAQDVPVLEATGCNAAFYILDSGEYQINVWTHEGKIYELISDSLDFTNARKRYYDPNE